MAIKQIPGQLKFFVNALSENAVYCFPVMITAVNRQGNEASIDALIEQDNYTTWLDVVKRTLGASWTVYEAVPIPE